MYIGQLCQGYLLSSHELLEQTMNWDPLGGCTHGDHERTIQGPLRHRGVLPLQNRTHKLYIFHQKYLMSACHEI